jgi:hypothetical protein
MDTGTSAGRSTKIDKNGALERNMALQISNQRESKRSKGQVAFVLYTVIRFM